MHTPGPWWNESGVIHAKGPNWTEDNHSCVHLATVHSSEDDGNLIATAPGMLDLCRMVADAPGTARFIMRTEGMAFDNLDDPWQKLAFTFYNIMVNDGYRADMVIRRSRGE